jgi:hypothetical protein
MTRAPLPCIATANRLRDGRVVFLSASGAWIAAASQAAVATDSESASELLERASRASSDAVIDPYLVEVEVTDEAISPVRLRERIRAIGPTVMAGRGASVPQSSDVGRD